MNAPDPLAVLLREELGKHRPVRDNLDLVMLCGCGWEPEQRDSGTAHDAHVAEVLSHAIGLEAARCPSTWAANGGLLGKHPESCRCAGTGKAWIAFGLEPFAEG